MGFLSDGLTTLVECPGGDRPVAAPGRPRVGRRIPLYALTADRVPLPASANLFRLRRPGARPARTLGRLLDDARADLPLPSVRDIRPRFRMRRAAGQFALVPAVALRPLARHQ